MRPASAFFLKACLLAAVAFALAGCGAADDPIVADATTTTTTMASSTTTTALSTTTTAAPTTTTTLFPAPAVSTVTDLLALDRPVIAGHAGGDQSWPHSTMFAFREAAKAGADVLEMDVQLTGDGVLIVQHDNTVDRTTETTGPVRDLSLDEIQTLDNAYWWSSQWSNHDLPASRYEYRGIRTGDGEPPATYGPDDFKVETFEAIATAFPDHVLDIEIKIPNDAQGNDDIALAIEGAKALAEQITALGRTDSVIVVSFNDEVIQAFRELAPGVATSPSVNEMLDWFFGTATFADTDLVAQVPPDFDGIEVLTPGIVDRVHAEGLEIWVWPNNTDTQETGEYYVEAIGLGADGIIAGHPDLAVDAYRAAGLIP